MTIYGPGEASTWLGGASSSTFDVVDCLPGMTKRLGFLIDPPRGFLATALGLKNRPPFDYWWKLEEDPDLMQRQVIEMRDCLMTNGIAWLQETATAERLQWAKRELDERKRSGLTRDCYDID